MANTPDFDSILFESMRTSSFDSVAWVNRLIEATSTGNAGEEEEALINTVRMATTRLQARSQELSRDAERLMERMLTAGPRAVQELDRVERDALALKQDLRRLQDESRISGDEATPFQTLKSLDLIKSNLEGCVRVLQETGNWNSLVRDMEAQFAARNLGEVAAKLAIMRESIATLANFPDAPKRIDMLERMEQRLEALVRPGLQSALEQLADGNKEPLKQSVTVFERLGQRAALLAIVGKSRGEHVFETALKSEQEEGAMSPDKKSAYTRFADRVFALLRDVEAPICAFAFGSAEARAEALAHIVRYCFERITSDLVLNTFIKQGSSVDAAGCERYGQARMGMSRLKRDVSLALLNALPQTFEVRNKAIEAIEKPFVLLDLSYLDWEASALKSELKLWLERKAHEDDVSGLDDILAKSSKYAEWERTLAHLSNADDALESLSEECAVRCARVGMGSVIPVARLFQTHAEETLKVVLTSGGPNKAPTPSGPNAPPRPKTATTPTLPSKATEEEDTMRAIALLKTCAGLKSHFENTVRRVTLKRAGGSSSTGMDLNDSPRVSAASVGTQSSSPRQTTAAATEPGPSNGVAEQEERALDDARGWMHRLVSEARAKLFRALLSPALALLDRGIEESTAAAASSGSSSSSSSPVGPSDAITRAVDYLYSLIALLDWDTPSTDLLASSDAASEERAQLEALAQGAIPFGTGGAASVDDPQELPRVISASWLEAICRGLSTGFVLRVLRLKKVSDRAASQLGMDADFLEKNTGSVLAQGVWWDPALGVCRVVMSAGPGLTHLKLGNPKEHLDERYFLEGPAETLKHLEHHLVALRNRS